MDSSYYGDPNMGNERSSSSSSRKGKKSGSNSDNKPNKQPQRGLGVAQLEKIRLNSQLGYLPNTLHAPPNFPTHLNQDMRLQTAYSSVPSSSSFSYTTTTSSPLASSYGFHGHQNIMMGMGDLERENLRYADSQPSTTAARLYPGSGTLETPHFAQHSMARHFHVEDSFQRKRKKDLGDSNGSSSQNSETSERPDLDLELRLSFYP